MLYRYGGLDTFYNVKTGLKRRFVLSGRIDDPSHDPLGGIDKLGDGNSAFHNKPVRVEIFSPPDPEWLGKVVATLQVDDVLGAVSIEASVEPERFDLDGETVEIDPISIKVALESDAFEAIRSQAVESYDHRRIMWAKVTLAGMSLPDPDNVFGFLRLKDLDVSKGSTYAIRDFRLLDTRYTDHFRDRILQIPRGRDEALGANLSILMTEARYVLNVERALPHSISCEGRVTNGRGKPYDNADVTVEFAEYESDKFDELPDRAFSGGFGYFPKRVEEGYAASLIMSQGVV